METASTFIDAAIHDQEALYSSILPRLINIGESQKARVES